MKKLVVGILTLFLALLTVVTPVLAFMGTADPCIVPLAIKTVPVEAAEGLTVILKQAGMPIAQKEVNQYYETQFEVSNIVGSNCGSFEAVILECEERAACHINVNGNPGPYVVWDLTSVPIEVPCPDCPTTTTIVDTYCEDKGYILPDECEDVVCPECEAITLELVIKFVVTIVLAAGSGYGIKAYVGKAGGVKLHHKHVGIRGYHSPDIVHRNPRYRHKKGEIAPKLPKY